MALDSDRHLGTYRAAIEDPAIANHNLKGGYRRGSKFEEFGNPGLHEIMGTTIVNQNRDTVVVDIPVYANCLECQHSQQGIEA